MLSIPNQLEGAYVGQDVALECHTEAYPTSINYWTTEKGDMIVSEYSRLEQETHPVPQITGVKMPRLNIFYTGLKGAIGEKYEAVSMDNGYNKYMMLKIRSVSRSDFGSYQCVAKNSLGETDEIPAPSTTTTSAPSTTTVQPHKKKGRSRYRQWKQRQPENQILEDYDVEEWRDTDTEDFTLPSLGPPEEAGSRGEANSAAAMNLVPAIIVYIITFYSCLQIFGTDQLVIDLKLFAR
uniref:Ig-like domain-containing protein n=1 Tax=Rhodnius prolixus TaxID=13249 RepID=T1HN27_RHOPR